MLRPGRGEAGHADGERATGEIEPGGPRRHLGLLLLIVSLDGPEGISVDGLTLEVGFGRGERVVGDPGNGGSGESEPRDLGDIQMPNAGNQRRVENGDNKERGRVAEDWGRK